MTTMTAPRPTDTTLAALLARHATERPGQSAFVEGEASLDFAALELASRRLAAGLAGLGIGTGDRVALWLPNGLAYVILFLACARLGACAVSVNTRFRAVEVGELMRRSGARALAYHPGFQHIDFDGILSEVAPQALAGLAHLVAVGENAGRAVSTPPVPGCAVARYDELGAAPPLDAPTARDESPAVIFTSSGTTRAPKLILHSQKTLSDHAQAVATAFGLDADGAATLQMVPLSGVYGFSQMMAALAGGAPNILMPAFDATEAVALIERHAVTHLVSTDLQCVRLLDEAEAARPFPSLRFAGFSAFTPSITDLVAQGDARGVPFVGLYGSSEIQALFAAQAPGDVHQAAEIAGEDRAGPGRGERLDLVRDHAAGDIGIFHAEGAAEAAADLAIRRLCQCQALDRAEQGAGAGLDAQLAQARAGIVIGDRPIEPRTRKIHVPYVRQKGNQLPGLGRQGLGSRRVGRIVGEERGIVIADHARAGTRGRDEVIDLGEGIEHRARDRTGLRASAGIIGGLAATALPGRNPDGAARRLQQLDGGKADTGTKQIDQTGHEEADNRLNFPRFPGFHHGVSISAAWFRPASSVGEGGAQRKLAALSRGEDAGRRDRPGKKNGMAATGVHPAGHGRRLSTRAPEQIAAHRAPDRDARVLGDHQPAQRPAVGIAGLEPEWRAVGQEFGIDRQAAAGFERHPLGADRALAFDRAEINVTRVRVHDGRRLGRMRGKPGADRLHRHLFARNSAAFDQDPANRNIVTAVIAGIADSQDPAVIQAHPARTLDMKKEGVDGIGQPEPFQTLPSQGAGLDLGSARPGLGALRRRVERRAIARRRAQRPGIFRLEIAGENALGIAVHDDPVRLEPILEIGARPRWGIGRGCAGRGPLAGGAGESAAAQRVAGGLAGQNAAGSSESGQRRPEVVRRPAREF